MHDVEKINNEVEKSRWGVHGGGGGGGVTRHWHPPETEGRRERTGGRGEARRAGETESGCWSVIIIIMRLHSDTVQDSEAVRRTESCKPGDSLKDSLVNLQRAAKSTDTLIMSTFGGKKSVYINQLLVEDQYHAPWQMEIESCETSLET